MVCLHPILLLHRLSKVKSWLNVYKLSPSQIKNKNRLKSHFLQDVSLCAEPMQPQTCPLDGGDVLSTAGDNLVCLRESLSTKRVETCRISQVLNLEFSVWATG